MSCPWSLLDKFTINPLVAWLFILTLLCPAVMSQEPTTRLSPTSYFSQAGKSGQKSAQKKPGAKPPAKTTTPGAARPANAGASNPSASRSAGAATLGPKRSGVVRIGVILPQVSSSGDAEGETGLEDAFRAVIIHTLTGPGIEAVPLQFSVIVHAANEARQKDCDYVLITRFEKKKGNNSLIGKAVGMASAIGSADLPGRSSRPENVKKTASSSATVGTEVNNWYKVGDRAAFSYELYPSSAVKALHKGKFEEKTEKEGDRVVTALLLKAANQLLPKIAK